MSVRITVHNCRTQYGTEQFCLFYLLTFRDSKSNRRNDTIYFTSPQVASWTHAGLHLGLHWHQLSTFLHDLHRALRRTATSMYRGHVSDLVIGLSVLPHHEHGTGCRQTWSSCDRQTHFDVHWKHFPFESVYEHQRTDWSA